MSTVKTRVADAKKAIKVLSPEVQKQVERLEKVGLGGFNITVKRIDHQMQWERDVIKNAERALRELEEELCNVLIAKDVVFK